MPSRPPRNAAGSGPGRRFRVWVAQGVWFENVYHGIARYAAEHGWELDTGLRWSRGPVTAPEVKPDGVIVFTAGTPGLEDVVRSLGVPIVDMEDYCDRYGAPKVIGDDREVGRLAARHLASRRPDRLFILTSKSQGRVTHLRREGFLAEALTSGVPAAVISDGADLLPALAGGVSAGVYACSETLACGLLRRCLEAGVAVPDRVAILSGDDFGTVCENEAVPLSSIDLDMENKGYVAAELLDRLLRGGLPPKKPLVVPPAGITARASTRVSRSGHETLDRLVRHLLENCRRRVGLGTLCDECGVPLRTAQHLLRQRMGVSPRELVTRFRLEAAERLEATGKLKLDSVARAVGYGGRSGLSRARRAAKSSGDA